MFDDILEFTDIPGKLMLHQTSQHFIRRPRNGFALQPIEPGNEMIYEQRNILAPISQAGQLQPHNVNPIKEVLTKAALLHQLAQVLVSSRNDPHIGLYGLYTTERLINTLLQHPQQPHLHGRRNIAYFIQKNGSAFREGEPARLVSPCVGKRPGLIAKQLRLQ
ncbi:hypothetical protein SDC9_197665 [bioreactor metagenome]|uniref:Uncharacterized protein n=1 Tax=bioreactor metagenome TaxID=1076179 RepID=A0A645IG04_9ZZZZ